ncbi:right-handed parallel beta-helix repeat-containing protein [Natranaerobius trueperi]|uniref:Right handed beta helix domain-containing protein n=1 Tax=Natranaerobius trueperi TaxID=759412 RepID=A0A226BWK3_9FIRM|nr:right-handed parallel beta-helix repeat-containing protein [Natranaerobius trueperi]OWZ83383.1 hypothetical protein CDO51_08760 [Natranaerobius trueperi]
MKKLSIILPLSMAFVLMMSGVGYANPISNELEVDVTVEEDVEEIDSQEALENAIEKDAKITLDDSFTIEDTIVIDEDNVEIDGNENTLEHAFHKGEIFEITADNVTVEDVTIVQTEEDHAPSEFSVTGENATIRDNTIERHEDSTDDHVPIMIQDVDEVTIKDNDITKGNIGLVVDNPASDDIVVKENTIIEVMDSEGIWAATEIDEEKDAIDAAYELAKSNTIEDYDAEGPVKVVDKAGNDHYSTYLRMDEEVSTTEVTMDQGDSKDVTVNAEVISPELLPDEVGLSHNIIDEGSVIAEVSYDDEIVVDEGAEEVETQANIEAAEDESGDATVEFEFVNLNN